jgi:KDO2-lipid IV(A) lauroyltransferase
MAEPLRRRARASLLRVFSSASNGPARSLVRASLSGAASLARFSRIEDVTLDNLRIAFGDELGARERRAIASGMRQHTARIAGEWLELASASRSAAAKARVLAWLARMVEFDASIARVDELAAKHSGLVIVTAHLGNWELLAAALRQRGLDGAVIGRHRRNDSSSNWLVSMRAAIGVTTLPQDASPREALSILRRGATLGILCDLEVPRLAGEFVPFFGRPALTMSAPAALARAAQLPLVPVRCVLRGKRYVMSVEEPLALDASLNRQAAQLDLLTRMNVVFERWIREDPAQWAWHQPRWRTAPTAGEGASTHRVPLAARRKRS